MNAALDHLQRGLDDLDVPGGWKQQSRVGDEIEYVGRCEYGELGIGGSRGFVEVDAGDHYWEDFDVRTTRGADRALAACDAVLARRLNKSLSKGLLLTCEVASIHLNTRGFDELLSEGTVPPLTFTQGLP